MLHYRIIWAANYFCCVFTIKHSLQAADNNIEATVDQPVLPTRMAAAPSSNIGESADDFRHLDDEALQDEIDITKCIINSLLDDQNLAGEARNQLYAEQKKLEDLRSAMNTRKQGNNNSNTFFLLTNQAADRNQFP